MAKAKQTITTKIHRKKYGEGTGYFKCNLCGGSGRVKKGYNKKKK